MTTLYTKTKGKKAKLDKITTGPLIPAFQSVCEGDLQDFVHILGIMKKYLKWSVYVLLIMYLW